MRVLITSNGHKHYDKTGEITGKVGGKWEVRIPNRTGSITTYVEDGEYKPVKIQESAASGSTVRVPDGAGCSERLPRWMVENEPPYSDNMYGY